MSLKKYQAKRDFNKTDEPRGRIRQKNFNRFVVQKHQASHLHYDFRLEWAGVLRSWAVPRGISKKTGEKRLAIQVEDHPVEYIDFSGTIPEGQYGAGKVDIWDKGEWQLVSGELDQGNLKIKLKGRMLTGEYALIRLKNKKNWLIFRVQ